MPDDRNVLGDEIGDLLHPADDRLLPARARARLINRRWVCSQQTAAAVRRLHSELLSGLTASAGVNALWRPTAPKIVPAAKPPARQPDQAQPDRTLVKPLARHRDWMMARTPG
jgi:hypothetical protein